MRAGYTYTLDNDSSSVQKFSDAFHPSCISVLLFMVNNELATNRGISFDSLLFNRNLFAT